MRTLLSYRGHEVEQASDGDSALAMAARRPRMPAGCTM